MRKVVGMVVGTLSGLLALPALIFGSYLLHCWIRIHSGDVFYVEYPYLLRGCVFLGIGLLSAACAAYGAFRRSFYGCIFVVPFFFGFGMLVYIPDGTPHVQR